MSSTPVPPPRRRAPQAERSVALIEALSRWQRAAGPFWPYVCAAPFLGEITVPTVRSGSSAMSDAFAARVTQLVEDAPDSMAAIYADVSPEMALAASGQLSAQQIATVPVIQRWVIDQARVPCGQLAAQLMAAPLGNQPQAARAWLFLLDGDRQHGVGDSPHALDNRYLYGSDRLPPSRVLRAVGIGRTIWISATTIAADLWPYTQMLAEAGLAPEDRQFPVRPRSTWSST